MADYKVSQRYATSLLGMAADKNNLEKISNDMEFISSVIETNNNLKLMLDSPVVKPKIKSSILEEIFKGKISEDSLKFLLFVVEKNREEFLYSIIKKFLSLKDQHLGIVVVDVKSAQEFSAEQLDDLKNKFEALLNKKVRFNFKIDESIIGGFVARVEDTAYDASIKHQLEILKKQFVEGGPSLN